MPEGAILVIPYRPECRWWKLTAGLNAVHVWEVSDDCLEEWREGAWRALKSNYRLALVSTMSRVLGANRPTLKKQVEVKAEWCTWVHIHEYECNTG